MSRFWKTLPMMALLIGIVLLGTPQAADAAFRLRIDHLEASIGAVITDNGAGDLNPLVDVIVFSGVVGGFTVNVAVGTKTPLLVSPGTFDAIDLTGIHVSSFGPGTVRVILETAGFTNAPDGPVALRNSVGGVLSGPAGSSAAFFSGANAANLVPTLGPDQAPGPIGIVPDLPPVGTVTAGPLVFGPGAFSGTTEAIFTKSGPYSLFSAAFIALTGPGSASYDHETATLPAPAALAMLFACSPVLGIAGLRYRRKKNATVVAV